MNKTEYKFGANILENLTTGMYQDSKIIYREYIQNSCDSIDKAVEIGLLPDISAGMITIWLDSDTRTICIEDNGTGIPSDKFQDTLGDVADSDKKIGENKGFRGIGRLCGLAYCKEVVFSSSVKGENIISHMRCDAQKMRSLLTASASGSKLSASDVLLAVNEFSVENTTDTKAHFFRVELKDVNIENTELLSENEIRDCLSFVAPVPYKSRFIFSSEIYKYVNEHGIRLDEYIIKLEGKQIFKEFSTRLHKADGKSYDEIFDIAFKNFYDDSGNLFAWMWVGLSAFKGAIPKSNLMRGLRLRKENIQVGNEDALQKLFKEDRGNSYFVGEVFAVSNELVPNSQRDYFNENLARATFERVLRKFFSDELHKIYNDGSTINSAQRKISTYENKVAEFAEKDNKNAFVSDAHRETELQKIEDAQKKAEQARKNIEKVKEKTDKNPESLTSKAINIIVSNNQLPVSQKPLPSLPESTKVRPRVCNLPQFSRSERKLISEIFDLILSATDSKTAELIITKIEDGLAE